EHVPAPVGRGSAGRRGARPRADRARPAPGGAPRADRVLPRGHHARSLPRALPRSVPAAVRPTGRAVGPDPGAGGTRRRGAGLGPVPSPPAPPATSRRRGGGALPTAPTCTVNTA